MAFIQNDKYQHEYDEMFDSSKDIENFPCGLNLAHQRYKGQMFVSGRDFVFLVHYTFDSSDGSIVIGCVSVEDPRVPPHKSLVRGKIKVRSQ